jgi:hypothetical protein
MVTSITYKGMTCPPKTDPIFKLGLGYNKTDIKGGKRYEQEAIYDGAGSDLRWSRLLVYFGRWM